jgi:ferric-dicitrate binding protein FerR (iron transport regulator)
MKTNDHNKRLFRSMQEEPDKYPDQEIEAMMDDLDQEADVDEAWQQFESEKLKVKSEKPTAALPTVKFYSSLRKVAASFVGLLLVSAVAIAAVHIVQHYQKPKAPQVTETTAVNTQLSTLNSQLKEDTLAKAEPVVFDNVTLDSIASDIAAYHHLDMEMQNEQTHQLRFYFVWNPDDSLQEVIEKLNMFEQVNLTVENGKLIVR